MAKYIVLSFFWFDRQFHGNALRLHRDYAELVTWEASHKFAWCYRRGLWKHSNTPFNPFRLHLYHISKVFGRRQSALVPNGPPLNHAIIPTAYIMGWDNRVLKLLKTSENQTHLGIIPSNTQLIQLYLNDTAKYTVFNMWWFSLLVLHFTAISPPGPGWLFYRFSPIHIDRRLTRLQAHCGAMDTLHTFFFS